MSKQLDLWPDYDQHVRVWRFVQEHEYQHMLWLWIDMERRRIEQLPPSTVTDKDYNIAQDYIINNLLK